MVSGVLITIGIAFVVILMGGFLLRRRYRLIGSLTTTTGLLIITAGMVFFLVMLNVTTYQRLTHEIPLATLAVDAKENGAFRVVFEDLNGGKKSTYILKGDEWQMDARFLKWRAWATVLGKDPLVRLERLSGRYKDPEKARTLLPSVYRLNNDNAIDVWELANKYAQMRRWVDAYYGSAVYMPLIVGALYQVNATASGLIVRPENGVAKQGVSAWQ